MTSEPLGPRHPEVQQLRRLLRDRSARRQAGVFVAEGARVVAEALAAGAVERLYLPPAAPVPAGAGPVEVRRVAAGVIERVADATTPQPLLALCRLPARRLADLRGDRVLVAVDVSDPGNAGTIVRSAAATGMTAVLFAGASVDPTNPKAVRASAGTLFHLPVVIGGDPVDVLEELGRRGMVRLGAAADGEPCDRVDLRGPVALVVGNEAHGLGADLPLDGRVSVPMSGPAESLNVAMATAILCYEVARQRG